MVNKQEYLEDITAIRSIMEKSSRFISLSGLAGVLAGIYATIGGIIANYIIYNSDRVLYYDIASLKFSTGVIQLCLIAIMVLLLSVLSAYILSKQKAKKNGQTFFDNTAKRLLLNFLIPLITGGLFILIMFYQGQTQLIAPSTLLFYGLACVQASKYTYNDLKTLGLIQIAIGLIAFMFHGYGLQLWILGFGIVHMGYGILMYFKYEK